MSAFTNQLIRSLTGQTATWFVGLVIACLGVFSSRIVEAVKFALNKADLRAKYYEELAVDLSSVLHAVDRLNKVYYGSSWLSDEQKSSVAEAYDESMNKIRRYEFVYLSWLQRFWSKKTLAGFHAVMDQLDKIDSILISLNEAEAIDTHSDALEAAVKELRVRMNTFLLKIS